MQLFSIIRLSIELNKRLYFWNVEELKQKRGYAFFSIEILCRVIIFAGNSSKLTGKKLETAR